MIDDPFELFASWYEEAQIGALSNPAVVALASANKSGRPSVRFVFYRGIREGGFSFFTNYGSRKGLELGENPACAMAFWWPHLGKQVRVEGPVERLSKTESDAYFSARSLESQVSATVSQQSQVLANAEEFLSQIKIAEDRASLTAISRPEYWGGFKVMPDHFEFWMRGEHRRHKRYLFKKEGHSWRTTQLYP